MATPLDPALDPLQQSTFGFMHAHSGATGDGKRVKAANLDTVDPFVVDREPTYIPVNAPTSGRKYRLQIVEDTDPETQQLRAVIQVVGVNS